MEIVIMIISLLAVLILLSINRHIRDERDKFYNELKSSKKTIDSHQKHLKYKNNEIDYLNKTIEALEELYDYENTVSKNYIKELATALDKKHEVGYANKLLSKLKINKENEKFGHVVLNYNKVQQNLIDVSPKKPEKKESSDSGSTGTFAANLLNALSGALTGPVSNTSSNKSHSSSIKSSYDDDSSYSSSSSYDSSSSSWHDSSSSSSSSFD